MRKYLILVLIMLFLLPLNNVRAGRLEVVPRADFLLSDRGDDGIGAGGNSGVVSGASGPSSNTSTSSGESVGAPSSPIASPPGVSTVASRREVVANALANTGVSPHWGWAVIKVEAGAPLRRGQGEIQLQRQKENNEWEAVPVPGGITAAAQSRKKDSNGNDVFTIQVIAHAQLTPGGTYRYLIKATPIGNTPILEKTPCWMTSDSFVIRKITKQELYVRHEPYTTLTFREGEQCQVGNDQGSLGDTAVYCWTYERELPEGEGLQYGNETETVTSFEGTERQFKKYIDEGNITLKGEPTRVQGPCSEGMASEEGGSTDNQGREENPPANQPAEGDNAVTPPAREGSPGKRGDSNENTAPAEGPGVVVEGSATTSGDSSSGAVVAHIQPDDLIEEFNLSQYLEEGGAINLFKLALESKEEAKKIEEAVLAIKANREGSAGSDQAQPSYIELIGRGYYPAEILGAWQALRSLIDGYKQKYDFGKIIDMVQEGDGVAHRALGEILEEAGRRGGLVQRQVIEPLERIKSLIDALNRLGPENERYESVTATVIERLKKINKDVVLLRGQGVIIDPELSGQISELSEVVTSVSNRHIQRLGQFLTNAIFGFMKKLF